MTDEPEKLKPVGPHKANKILSDLPILPVSMPTAYL
jgi:hypothetical protein